MYSIRCSVRCSAHDYDGAGFWAGLVCRPLRPEEQEPGKTVVREGDVSVGAAIRTDERYNNMASSMAHQICRWNRLTA